MFIAIGVVWQAISCQLAPARIQNGMTQEATGTVPLQSLRTPTSNWRPVDMYQVTMQQLLQFSRSVECGIGGDTTWVQPSHRRDP